LEIVEGAGAELEMSLGSGGDGLRRKLLARLRRNGPVGFLQFAPCPSRMVDLADAREETRRLAPAGELQSHLAVGAPRQRREGAGSPRRLAELRPQERRGMHLFVVVRGLRPGGQCSATVLQ